MNTDNSTTVPIVEYVTANGKITNRECRKLLGVTYDEAIKLLNTMCEAGLLQRTGVASGTKYILKENSADAGVR